MTNQKLYSVNEAALILGVKPSTLRRWRFDKKLFPIRVGTRLIKIPQSEIDRIISEGREPDLQERPAGLTE